MLQDGCDLLTDGLDRGAREFLLAVGKVVVERADQPSYEIETVPLDTDLREEADGTVYTQDRPSSGQVYADLYCQGLGYFEVRGSTESLGGSSARPNRRQGVASSGLRPVAERIDATWLARRRDAGSGISRIRPRIHPVDGSSVHPV